jgi:hypothetical protein
MGGRFVMGSGIRQGVWTLYHERSTTRKVSNTSIKRRLSLFSVNHVLPFVQCPEQCNHSTGAASSKLRKMACRLAPPHLTSCLLPLPTEISSFALALRSKSRRNIRNSLRRSPTENGHSNISRSANRLDHRLRVRVPQRRHSRHDNASCYGLRRRSACESESGSDDIGIVA